MKNYLTEAIGTFFLVLTVGLCINDVDLGPLAIGATYMVMVYAGGPISGGHYNPAVSCAVWLRGRLPSTELIPYWGAQFAGGLLAAFLIYKFTGHPLHVAPGDHVTWMKALTAEAIFSFALAYVMLHVATAKASAGNSYFGLAIGFTLTAGLFAVGGITGGAFNPAVGLASAFTELLLKAGPSSMAWIYAVGPLLGGAAAAYTFKYQRPGE